MYPLNSYYHARISKKQGVAANILYPYVGPTYIHVGVVIIRNRYYFGINVEMDNTAERLDVEEETVRSRF